MVALIEFNFQSNINIENDRSEKEGEKTHEKHTKNETSAVFISISE